jgi:hypothetical protein
VERDSDSKKSHLALTADHKIDCMFSVVDGPSGVAGRCRTPTSKALATGQGAD